MHSRTFQTNRILLSALMAGCISVAAPAWAQAIGEDHKITASDGSADHEFGYSIAVDAGIVAVGARKDDDNGTNSGSAYLFDAFTGNQIVKLLPDDGAAGDEFGFSIAIDNGIVVVGSYRDDHNGITSGSAYLFDASTGEQLMKLISDDAASGDEFGFAVAIDNGVVAVGAKRDDDNGSDCGSVYLFDAVTGAQLAKLLPEDGAADDNFGEAVSMDSGILAVGAHGGDEFGPLSGSAYTFDISTLEQIAKLVPEIGTQGDFFGAAIGIDNGIVAVGASYHSHYGKHSGAAYLFHASSGAQIAKVVPDDGWVFDRFGYSISIDDGIVAVGSFQDTESGFNSGSAYLFDASDGAQLDKLLASDGTVGDKFGYSICIDNGIVAVGAIGDDDAGSYSGSAYVFGSGAPSCPADVTGDAVVDVLDLLEVLSKWGGSGSADVNGDGIVDVLDLLAVLSAWGPCP